MNKNLHEVFKQLGIEEGGWVEAENVEYEPKIMEKQRALLEKIKALLESQIKRDQQTIAHLREELNREKFGGGK
jgi:hypothetical protein